MHSYAFYNGHLSEIERRLHALDEKSTVSLDLVYQNPNIGDRLTPEESCAKIQETSKFSVLREDLANELTSATGSVTYPGNLTWSNYLDYILCPTLCYELEYPRTERIVWSRLGYKILAVFGVIFLLTITSEEFIVPVLAESATRIESARLLKSHVLRIGISTLTGGTAPIGWSFLASGIYPSIISFEDTYIVHPRRILAVEWPLLVHFSLALLDTKL
ncbi:hypothetical protein Golomagni_01262 [Golovinomyces magnicellulatus]|nr:hypothetical protein Golomagni_01262 [Golovinomyces magnicellulatus]